VNMFNRKSVGWILLFICLLWALPALAQPAGSARPDEMYERYLSLALNGAVSTVIKGGVILPANWMADGRSFWFAEGAPDDTVIIKVDPRSNSRNPLFDTTRLRGSLARALGHEAPYKGLPFQSFAFGDGERTIRFTVEGKEWACDLGTYEVKALPPPSEEEKKRAERLTPLTIRNLLGAESGEILSPDSRWFAGTKDFNLYLRSASDDQVIPLTSDGLEGYGWDIWNASPQWSPDSSKLAITKVDDRAMPRMPVVRWLKTPEEVEWAPYARAGAPLWKAELFVFDVAARSAVRVPIDRKGDYFLSIVGWFPDGTELLFYTVDREFKELVLTAADPRTGASRPILTETQKTFLNVDAFARLPLTFVDAGREFLWLSERDGWNQVYLYGRDGRLIRRLTAGRFVVDEVKAVDERRGWVYFTAQVDAARPYDPHLCRVDLEGKRFARLTEAEGDHIIQISPSNEYFLDINGSLSRPPATELRRADGKLLRVVASADINALKEKLQWSPAEAFRVKAADGRTDLYGVLFKPYDFDPAKKYPVIDYIYNGPHSRDVPGNMYTCLTDPEPAIAHLGCILIQVDGRGTIGRGKEFQDVNYGRLGQDEVRDHVAALRQLAEERPYIDLARVGVHGISWGGYLTLRAMLLAPDVFKVGVATAPLVDLDDAMSYTEHYMGLPQNNRKGYEEAAVLPLAKNLEGRLMLIHGTVDRNAPFSETIKMIEALMKARKPVDVLILPEQPHVPQGDAAAYWVRARHRYFREHLLASREAAGLEKIAVDERIVPFLGDYDFQGYTVPVISRDGKTLILIVPGQPEYELAPGKGQKYAVSNAPGFSVEFLVDESGKVTGLKLIQPSGESYTLKKK
jgi:dipeptidyl aminopeptidase/acylaminoacyl peptidase